MCIDKYNNNDAVSDKKGHCNIVDIPHVGMHTYVHTYQFSVYSIDNTCGNACGGSDIESIIINDDTHAVWLVLSTTLI